jgi:hypothetical protein
LEYTYHPPKNSQPGASGYSSGYLLIAILSLISLVIAAAGVSSLTGLPFLACAFFAAIVYATKMYFIRPQVKYEEIIGINWDEMVFYLITAFIFVMLAAFGLFCLNSNVSAASVYQQPNGEERSTTTQGVDASTVESAKNEEKSDKRPSTDNIRRFLKETVAMDTYALGCWFLPAVLEILIVLLVFHNRTRYEYWD